MLKIDGYDDCVVGATNCWNGNEKVDRLIYSGDLLVKSMMKDGMDEEEAIEYIDYNISDAYVGPDTPMIMWSVETYEGELH